LGEKYKFYDWCLDVVSKTEAD